MSWNFILPNFLPSILSSVILTAQSLNRERERNFRNSQRVLKKCVEFYRCRERFTLYKKTWWFDEKEGGRGNSAKSPIYIEIIPRLSRLYTLYTEIQSEVSIGRKTWRDAYTTLTSKPNTWNQENSNDKPVIHSGYTA